MQINCSKTAEITKLDQTDTSAAEEIHSIMQAAYRIEADLLNADDFFPLKRTIEDIKTSNTSFYGISIDYHLAAVIEFENHDDQTIEIDSLVVKPAFFRQGLGRMLLEHIFSMFPQKSFLVSTGIKNFPAVQLYRNTGFTESRRWQTPCGLDMVSLTRPPRQADYNMNNTASETQENRHAIDYSIIIPAFNESEEIGKTLATLNLSLLQTSLKGEIIVVDNDSTDETAIIAEQYGARVVNETVRKIAKVRNRGAEAAKGRYLIFVDADTIVEPPIIFKALELLEGGQIAGGGATLEFDRPQHFFARALLRFWLMLSRRAKLAAGCFIYCTARAFKEVGGFDESVYASEDVRLSFQLRQWACRNSKKLQIIDMPGIRTSSRKNNNHPHFFLTFLIFSLFPLAVRFKSLCFFWYRCRQQKS